MSKIAIPFETQNSYIIISGYLTIIGKQPDGDSLGFIPKDFSTFNGVYRSHLLKPSPKDNALQLRFEGIDTPELHYVSDEQPFGKQARDHVLSLAKFSNVVYKKTNGKESSTVISSLPEKVEAFIACNGVEPHGRPICYVFLGTTKYQDGQGVQLSTNDLKLSLNYQMLSDGFAYLLTYSSMPKSHADFFRAAAVRAKVAKKNIWSADTTSQFVLTNKYSVEGIGAQLIFPKLFRRCMDYFNDVEKGFTGTLIDWLHTKSERNDMVLQYGSTKEVPFSSLIKQNLKSVKLQADINTLIFIEK